MKDITIFIKETLYPAIRGAADRAFPELNFTKRGEKWESNHDLQGGLHKSKDQAVIKGGSKAYGIWEQTAGRSVDFIDYVRQRDNSTTFGAVETLCKALGLQIPQNEYNLAAFKEKQQRSDTLQSLYEEGVKALRANQTFAAQMANSYLHRRGLSDGDISAMGLGVIDTSLYMRIDEQLRKLYGDKYKTDSRIGRNYTVLYPPYKDNFGHITGFDIRATDGSTSPKTINTSCNVKGKTLYALNRSLNKAEDTLVICEGELDALHAQARGLRNVAAMTGNTLKADEIEDAKKKGWKRFILVPDTEEKDTKGKLLIREGIKNKLETIIKAGGTPFIAFLPLDEGKSKQDIDSFLSFGHHQGSDLQDIFKSAPYGYYWLVENIVAKAVNKADWKYYDHRADFGDFTDLQKDTIKGDIYQLAQLLKENELTTKSDIYTNFIDFAEQSLGISKADLDKEAIKIEQANERNRQNKEITDTITELSKLIGTPDKALALMEQTANKVRQQQNRNTFEDFLTPDTEDTIKAELATEGEDLKTGLFFNARESDDKELLLPNKAISFVVAPTSHGKSTMLENLALRVAERNPEKKILYLTYEESKPSVIANFISILAASKGATPSRGRVRHSIKADLKGDSQFIGAAQGEAYKGAKAAFFELLKTRRLNIRYVNFDADTLVNCVKFMEANEACDIVFVDYVQLISKIGWSKSRQEELKDICLSLHDLAVSKEYGLPIVAAAQFNRDTKTPLDLLSTNIGEAGDLERIADTILGIWNCGFTKTPSKDTEKKFSDKLKEEFAGLEERNPNKLYCKLLKRRQGEPNVKALFDFDGRTGLITDPQAAQMEQGGFQNTTEQAEDIFMQMEQSKQRKRKKEVQQEEKGLPFTQAGDEEPF
jgi:DNA primase